MESTDLRKKVLLSWLKSIFKQQILNFHALAGDASFRRYFRFRVDGVKYLAVDAPPETENTSRFIALATCLQSYQIQTPKVYQKELNLGFMVIADFGDDTYLSVLNSNNAEQLYKNALTVLAKIQGIDTSELSLPLFSTALMMQEWTWHKEWFLQKLLKVDISHITALDKCYFKLISAIDLQPKVFMHRDYHSANLMRLENGATGVLDFQDAFVGPITYDVASLLRDCYIDWPVTQVMHWLDYFYKLTWRIHQTTLASYTIWFDWVGIQRHIKALMTFARKAQRDQQPAYLTHVPRTLRYIIDVSKKYSDLIEIHAFYTDLLNTKFNKEHALCGR